MPIREPTTLERLHDLLRNGHALTQAAMSERLGVSPRQVRRLLDRLRAGGLPIQEEWSNGRKKFFLPGSELTLEEAPVPLTERQALALIAAAVACRAAFRPTPLADPLGEAFDLLIDRLSTSIYSFDPARVMQHWHFGETATVNFDPDVFDTLTEAIRERQSVRIDYHTASTDTFHEGRKIDPLLIAEQAGTWLCVAYCHLRETVRDFALAGIETIEPCDPAREKAYFKPPEDFDPELHFRDRFGALAGREVYLVRLLVEPEGAPYFYRKTYHPTQQIEERRADGRLVVSYEVAGLKEIASFVLSWGSRITVLEPPELIERVQAELVALSTRYATPPSSSPS